MNESKAMGELTKKARGWLRIAGNYLLNTGSPDGRRMASLVFGAPRLLHACETALNAFGGPWAPGSYEAEVIEELAAAIQEAGQH